MSRARILIVEDEIIIARGTSLALGNLGYEVVGTANSGMDAVEKAFATKPDLILMDIYMPGEMDGITASEKIREKLDVPVIFTTAYGDEETINRARETGPFGYILKPYDKTDLHSSIEMGLFKHAAEKELRRHEKWQSMILKTLSEAVITTDADFLIVSVNPVALRLLGIQEASLMNQPLTNHIWIDDGKEGNILRELHARNEGLEGTFELRLRSAGKTVPADFTIAPIMDEGTLVGMLCTFRDISVRQKAEKERESLINDLQDALEKVKKLRGLLPICSHCKKIRDDSGYWTQVEDYITTHSDAEFTHGLCPTCAAQLYPEYFEKDEGEEKGPEDGKE